jgi:hypothetical protein
MALQAKFSTGVRLPELRSIATIVCHLANLQPPSRDENRSCALLMRWFCSRWAVIAPWLPSIRLLDETGKPIDGVREMADMGI